MKLSVLGIAVTAMLLYSCGRHESTQEVANVMPADSAAESVKHEEKQKEPALDETGLTLQSGAPGTADWDKKIIKTARVSLELKDFKAFDKLLHSGLKAYGAYIAGENQTNTAWKLDNEVSIKVPVDQFENLLNSFSGAGITMLEKNISTNDVTGEVVDIKARAEAKKQVRDRYLELLKQAKTMKDILAVQQDLNALQEDIESATGRAGYLVHQAAYSTINLNYFQLLKPGGEEENPSSFFGDLKTALKESFGLIGKLILFLTYTWPLWIAAAGLFFLYKRRKQWSARKPV